MTLFGAATLLAAIGLCGVLAHWVSQRTREIGIRLAPAAQPQGVPWLVARHALWLPVIGLGADVPLAPSVGGALRSLLYGVHPHDAGTFVAVVLRHAGGDVHRCARPAVRAARVDPLVTLRYE